MEDIKRIAHRDLIVWQMITQLADRIMQMHLLRVCIPSMGFRNNPRLLILVQEPGNLQNSYSKRGVLYIVLNQMMI